MAIIACEGRGIPDDFATVLGDAGHNLHEESAGSEVPVALKIGVFPAFLAATEYRPCLRIGVAIVDIPASGASAFLC